VLAPALLVAIRLLQGLSVGGEFSSSATYLVETAPRDRRGVTGSWANIGSMVGSLLGVGAAALVTNLVDADTLSDWAWRLPFLGGGLIGATAILIRRSLHESERFEQHHAGREETSPLLEAFTTNRRETLLALAFAASYGTCFYVAFVYLPEWLTGEGLMDRGRALADQHRDDDPGDPLDAADGGYRRSLAAAAQLDRAGADGDRPRRMAVARVDAGLGRLHGVGRDRARRSVRLDRRAARFGPRAVRRTLPQRDRLSGYSVAFNLGVGVFGGLTPMIATSLIAATGAPTAPALYAAAAALIATAALMAMPDRSRTPLR
jgi:MHS family proline/betaine transporter-like MFS transporter